MWYANNRLGFNSAVCHCWGGGLPKPINLIVLTRVMEKPGLLSACILEAVVEKVWGLALAAREIDALRLWSDCAPNFRCRQMASMMGYYAPLKWRIHTGWCFGLENHMKGIPDGVIGELENARNRAATKELIKTLDDVQRVYDQLGNIKVAEHADNCELQTIQYMPMDKLAAARRYRLIESRSLPLPLSKSHMFTWTINDTRSKSLCGIGCRKTVVTAVDCKAHRLPGMRATADLKTNNILEPLADALPIEDEAADEIMHLHELAEHTKEHMGWRISYRKAAYEEELSDPSMNRPKLKRTFEAFEDLALTLPKASRRHTMAHVIAGKPIASAKARVIRHGKKVLRLKLKADALAIQSDIIGE
jgi:hypothetical protein